MQDAARAFGIQINVVNASTESEIDTAFTTVVHQRADAPVVATDPFLLGQRDQLATSRETLIGRHIRGHDRLPLRAVTKAHAVH